MPKYFPVSDTCSGRRKKKRLVWKFESLWALSFTRPESDSLKGVRKKRKKIRNCPHHIRTHTHCSLKTEMENVCEQKKIPPNVQPVDFLFSPWMQQLPEDMIKLHSSLRQLTTCHWNRTSWLPQVPARRPSQHCLRITLSSLTLNVTVFWRISSPAKNCDFFFVERENKHPAKHIVSKSVTTSKFEE